MSTSTRNTPIRAIQSTLSAESSLSIPPASQIYKPLVKSVLRKRILRVFLHSALSTWMITALWTGWSRGGVDSLGFSGWLANWVLPSTLLLTLLNWTVGVLPAVVLRKAYITAEPSLLSSPSATLRNALSKPRTGRALATYLGSSILVAIVHMIMAYAIEFDAKRDPALAVFGKSRKHPYRLNGRFVFLILSQSILASVYLLRAVLLDRFLIRWPSRSISLNKNENATSRLLEVLAAIVTSVLLTSLSFVCCTGIFLLSRWFLLPTLSSIPVLRSLIHPFVGHFLRGQWVLGLLTRHSRLLVRTYFLGLTTIIDWEFAEGLFGTLVAEPINVAHTFPDPALALASGISAPSSLHFVHFAYAEFAEFAAEESSTSSQRRTALFGDQKYNPTMWTSVAHEALSQLEKDHQILLRRGQPPPKAPSAASAAPPKVQDKLPSTPLIHKPLFKPTPPSPIRSILDSLASEGTLSQAVEETAEASHIPQLFQSVASSLPQAPALMKSLPTPPQGGANALVKSVWNQFDEVLNNLIIRRVPKWAIDGIGEFRKWWTTPRVSRVAEGCVPNRELDVLVIEALSHLVAASLTEDRYGAVQRDIPKVLDAFISFLIAVEDYEAEVRALCPELSTEQQEKLSSKELFDRVILMAEVSKACDVLSVVSNALREGIGLIVRTFGDKLTAFKFPPRIARKLQGFVDYSS